jgi:ribosomal protein S6E (S10)
MKKFITTFMLAFALLGKADAQAPQAFNYQGIARNTQGIAMANQQLNLKLSVIDGTEAGTVIYTETQEVSTNQFGLYTLHIGEGKVLLGNFAAIPWQLKNKYIKVELDANDGNGLVDLGTTQLLSVPYALYAERSGNTDNVVTQDQISRAGTQNFISKFDATGSSANTINSQIFDNGTSVGIGTTAPDATTKLQINRTGSGGFIRMVNTDTNGVGTFRLINDVPTNFATFSKYGSKATGGYSGIATLYPFANILGYGNNGPFLNAGTGNIGFAVTTGGTNKLKIHIDAATLRVGLGGNAVPQQLIHINSTDAGVDANIKMTSNNSGHTATDGFDIKQNSGNNVRLTNLENAAVIIGTNNTDRMIVTNTGDVGIGTNAPTAKLEVAGQVKITGGTPGAGKVLTSDSAGLATWQTPSGGGTGGSGVSTVNGAAGAVTTSIVLGTAGTTPSITGSGSNSITIDLPFASNTNSGILSAANFAGLASKAGTTNGVQNQITKYSTANTITASTVLTESNNNIGIGTTTPGAKLEVNGQVKITGGAPAAGKVLTSDAAGLATWQTPSGGGNISGTGLANFIPKFTATNTIGTSQILDNGTSVGISSNSSISALYKLYVDKTQLTANGDGQSVILGYRFRDNQNNGTAYANNTINCGVKGASFYGDNYSFGTAGFNYNDFVRSGGVLGAEEAGSYWGALGYRSSTSVNYGVYGSSAYANGAGYLPTNQVAGIGGGFFGNLVGSVSKGKVIGQMNAGELLAAYNQGDEYTSGSQIELVNNGSQKVPAYSVTSTQLTIYNKGKVNLVNGIAFVPFDKNYSSLLADVPVVTVSAMGECNGVYIASVTREGFTIKEFNNGNSNTNITWIAVGDRIDYTAHQVPASLLQNSFDTNLQQALYDDNNKENNGQGMWWDGAAKTINFGAVPVSTQPVRTSFDVTK